MNHREYQKLRRQIDDKYRADIEALERIWQLSQPAGPARAEARPDGLIHAVKNIVSGMTGTFSKKTVTNRLRESDPSIPASVQNFVGTILKRLDDAGEIRRVRVGQGKRPSDYEVVREPRTTEPGTTENEVAGVVQTIETAAAN